MGMDNIYVQKIRDLALGIFEHEDVRIILFGSRARGDNNRRSDVDIGIIPRGRFDSAKITVLRDRIDELNVPYKVEVVNFAEASPDFTREALKGAISWKG